MTRNSGNFRQNAREHIHEGKMSAETIAHVNMDVGKVALANLLQQSTAIAHQHIQRIIEKDPCASLPELETLARRIGGSVPK